MGIVNLPTTIIYFPLPVAIDTKKDKGYWFVSDAVTISPYQNPL